ncbi:MAG: hypothetical protein LBU70_02760 [Chitinispirillales bacterium]|jgi:hypothetical protein|nr:hypothetical protein [Chitinispirillales bacterium]
MYFRYSEKKRKGDIDSSKKTTAKPEDPMVLTAKILLEISPEEQVLVMKKSRQMAAGQQQQQPKAAK